MSEIFNTYEIELENHFRSLYLMMDQKEFSQNSFREIREELHCCEQGLKLLETEQVSLQPPYKSQYSKKVKEKKKLFEGYRKKIYQLEQKHTEALESEKKDLLGTRPNSHEMIKNSQMISSQNQQLKDSVKLMYENLEISDAVDCELKSHSGRLINNKAKLQEVQHDLSKSERTIKNMMVRIRRNRSIVYGVLGMIFLVLVIALVCWARA